MQGKEKESHYTGSKGRRSKYLQLPISKRDMEKMPKGTIDVVLWWKKNGNSKFSTKNKTKNSLKLKEEKWKKSIRKFYKLMKNMFKDKKQTCKTCLKMITWLLRTSYQRSAKDLLSQTPLQSKEVTQLQYFW